LKIDKEDFGKVASVTWSIFRARNKDTNTEYFYYAQCNAIVPGISNKNQILHRVIMDAPKGMVVDHINKDTLDNRKSNLRICTQSENRRNTKAICANNTSGVKGVTWSTKDNKWMSYVYLNNKFINLGYSDTIEEAAKKRKAGEEKYYGEFAPVY
jgi:hypothetical protein